ncbi:MAG: hypothetical protein WD448_11295 [Woeseia sp.]
MNDPINDPMSDDQGQLQRQSAGRSENGKERARQAAHEATESGKRKMQEGSERAAGEVDDLADAVGSAASRLSELEHEGLADYASQLSEFLGDMSRKLRNKSVDELARDVGNIADRNPALFILGSVAIGIGLSRFAKAGRGRHESQRLGTAGDQAEWRGQESGMFRTERSETELDSQSGVTKQMTPDATGGSGL